ncbi:MAG: hypothetical protein ACLFSE_12185 [Spirochaetia bacterium]
MMITMVKITSPKRVYYYHIHDWQGDLFCPYALTVSWGYELTGSRRREYVFDTRKEMDLFLRGLIRKRLKKGYKVLYTYFTQDTYRDLQPLLKKSSVS